MEDRNGGGEKQQGYIVLCYTLLSSLLNQIKDQ